MRLIKIFRCIVVLLVIYGLSVVQTSYGQWKQIIKFSVAVRSVYFLDQIGHPEIGFAGLQNGEIWRTTDTGLSWQKEFAATDGLPIDDITFKDVLTGWLVTDNRNAGTPSVVFSTIDGGLTWQAGRTGSIFTAIQYLQSTKILLLSEWNSGGFSSTDDGVSWNTFTSVSGLNGFSFSDQLHGIVTLAGATPNILLLTQDGGVSWQQQSSSQNVAAWQSAPKPGTKSFFTFSEYTGRLLRSDDGGINWVGGQSIGNGGYYEFTGCLRISECGRFYVQSTGNVSSTFYTSSDEGISWQSIGGPVNDVDTRFWINGNDVYASDLSGNLLMYRPAPTSLSPVITPTATTILSKDCESISSAAYLISQNCGMNIDTILSAGFSGSSSFTLNSSGTLPRKLFIKDSVAYSYHPSGFGPDTGYLTLRFMVGGREVDTVLQVIGNSLSRTTPLSLRFGDTTLLSQNCDTAISFAHMLSNACLAGIDSIESISLTGSNAFSLDPSLNLSRRFVSEDSLRIKYFRIGPGADTALLTLRIRIHGILIDTSIRFTGSASKTYSAFTPQLNIQSSAKLLPIESGKDTTIVFSLSGSVPASSGLDSLNFDLKFDPQMLTLKDASAISGLKISITELHPGSWSCWLYNPSHLDIAADQSLAFFHFFSYLTKDTVSQIYLLSGNTYYDPLTHNGCLIEAFLQDDSLRVQAMDICGDKTLRQFLVNGIAGIQILSIKPNPASEAITVETRSSSAQEVTAVIYDDFGKQYIQSKRDLQGEMTFPISISSLPSGAYHLVLQSAFGNVSSDFVKLK